MVEPDKVGLSTHELFFLDIYRTEGATDFAGPAFDFLFEQNARQLGSWHPSVLHAGVALTARGNARAKSYWNRFGDGLERQNNFVLRQTNKSITHLLQLLAPNEGGLTLNNRALLRQLVVTTCVIWSMLANCQDDEAVFQMHVMFLQQAMKEWEDDDFDNSSSTINRAVVDPVIMMDFRLKAQSKPALFLQDDSPLLLDAVRDVANLNVSYIEENVNRHWDLWSRIMLPQRPDGDGFSSGTVDDSDSTLRTPKLGHMMKARRWIRQLRAYIQDVDPLAPQSLHDLVTLLQLWEQAMCAKVSAAVAADEDPVWKPLQMRYDVYWPYFRCVNELGKKLLWSLIRQDMHHSSFPIDQAVVTPLFFCGLHCRNWSIRRETLHLLQAWGKRFETAFLPMTISALERIIDIESLGLQPGTVVPESARIHFVQVIRGSSGTMGFSYLQLGMSNRVDEDQ